MKHCSIHICLASYCSTYTIRNIGDWRHKWVNTACCRVFVPPPPQSPNLPPSHLCLPLLCLPLLCPTLNVVQAATVINDGPTEAASLLSTNGIEIRTHKTFLWKIDFEKKIHHCIRLFLVNFLKLSFVHWNDLILIDFTCQQLIQIFEQTTSKLCPITNFTMHCKPKQK